MRPVAAVSAQNGVNGLYPKEVRRIRDRPPGMWLVCSVHRDSSPISLSSGEVFTTVSPECFRVRAARFASVPREPGGLSRSILSLGISAQPPVSDSVGLIGQYSCHIARG